MLVYSTKQSNRQLEQWLELMEELDGDTGSIPGQSSAGGSTVKTLDSKVFRPKSHLHRLFTSAKTIVCFRPGTSA